MNVNVKTYWRRSPKGKRYLVKRYSRNVETRGNYNVPYMRQLPQSASNKKAIDQTLKAKKPGFRYSASGKNYYERRYNRSDNNTYL